MSEFTAATTYARLDVEVRRFGLMCRGGFSPQPSMDLPVLESGLRPRALVLIGNAGPALFDCFLPEQVGEGVQQPLDHWTRTVVDDIAGTFSALALYPFQGPPYWPFLTWARRCEPVSASPIGPLLHREYGFWHAYRAALLFADELDLPQGWSNWAHACTVCTHQACLSSCPVAAFDSSGYDVPGCARHLSCEVGRDCLELGCRARRACPVGQAYRYSPAQAKFHMAAFLAARAETGNGTRSPPAR